MTEIDEAIEKYKERKKRGRPRGTAGIIHPEVRSIYVPDELQSVWTAYQEIVKREGKTVSEAIVEYVCEYTRMHAPGNPQQRLDTIMDLGRAYRSDQCNMCERKPVFKAFLGKKSVLLCEEHFEQKRGWFMGWKKL